jgi:DNA-binding CsgD family transcriptional regulator
MHGREAERRVVRDLLHRAKSGNGGVVLVEGERGIGKSMLLGESVDMAAESGFSLAVDAADQLGQVIPFCTLRRALGESFAETIADFANSDLSAAPGWWINQIRVHLEQRAGTNPVLVCLDDLHWASPATLAALRTLPRELKHRPIAWVLARSSSVQRDAEHLFSLLENDGAARISLAPLATDGVAALLADTFGAPPDFDLRTLAEGAAGNPWLLAELIGGLRDEEAVRVTDGRATLVSDRLPERVRQAARQRLDGVSKRARHLLLTCAMLGTSFRLEDAAEMLAVSPAVLLHTVEETMCAGITSVAENGFSFTHQLLRRAVRDLIPSPGRKALHRQYGQLLLGRGESPILAASHLMRAADPDNPASLADLDVAAERTLRSAPQTAADLASYVLELTPPGDPGALPRAVAAAETLAAAGRLDKASRIARDALAKPLPPIAEARLRCALSSALCSRGRAGEAAAEARVVLTQPNLPDDLRANATAAYLQAVAGAREELAGSLVSTVLAASDKPDSQVLVAALVASAVLAWDKGRVGEALELLRDAARRETAVSPDARRVQPLLVLVAALIDLRQLEEAEAILNAADTGALRATPAQAAASILRARIHYARGRLTDATTAGQHALAMAETLGADGYACVARCVLAMIALRGGDVTSAALHLAGGPLGAPGFAARYARAETMLAQAQVSEARDGSAAAIGWIRMACEDLPEQPGLLLGDPAAAAWLTRRALAAGEDELVVTLARAAEDLLEASPEYPAVTAAAAHGLGVAKQETARLASAAVEHADPWARASAAEDLGALFAQQASRDQAIVYLTQAIGDYQTVGAVADMARIRRRLRALGVRRRHWAQPGHRPATGWGSLTDAERTASELAAQGLNNRQIADRMYISVHTVAFYMRQSFRKLSIGSRVELARIVVEQGPAAAKEG